MSHANNGQVLPYVAGSAIGQGVVAVMPLASGGAGETVIPAPSGGFAGKVVGITQATQPSAGYEVAIVMSGVAKARAAASLGAGAWVGAASTNGALGPVLPSAGAQASSGVIRQVVGYAKEAAAAGEYFACVIEPALIF